MLKIRLKRMGRRNQPFFRLVVTDARKGPKSSRAVEEVGFYNPLTKEKQIKSERVSYWMGVGAQPSDTVYNMLVDEGLIEGKKKNVLPRKSPVVKEVAEEEKPETAKEPSESAGDSGETPQTKEGADEEKTGEKKTEEDSEKTNDAPKEDEAKDETKSEKDAGQREESTSANNEAVDEDKKE